MNVIYLIFSGSIGQRGFYSCELANNLTKHNLINLSQLLQSLQYFASTLLFIDVLHLISVRNIDTLEKNLMKESHNLTLTISHCPFTGSCYSFKRKAFGRIFIDFLQNMPSALCLYHVCHGIASPVSCLNIKRTCITSLSLTHHWAKSTCVRKELWAWKQLSMWQASLQGKGSSETHR